MTPRRLSALWIGACLLVGAQDPPAPVRIPDLPVARLGEGALLAGGSWIDAPFAGFLRELRQLPELDPEVVRPPPEKRFLDAPSEVVDTGLVRIESCWLGVPRMTILARLAHKAVAVTRELLDSDPLPLRLGFVFAGDRDGYFSMIDRFEKDAARQKQSRVAGAWVLKASGTRCSWSRDWPELCALVVSDSICARAPLAWRLQDVLMDGFHSYLTSWFTGRVTCYASYDVTTPMDRDGSTDLEALYRVAKKAVLRRKTLDLEPLLRVELNSITSDRQAVAVALVDLLLRSHRDGLKTFVRVLQRETFPDPGPVPAWVPPDRRQAALRIAFKEGLGIDLEGMAARLQQHVQACYGPDEERIARSIGLDREFDAEVFEKFEASCRRRRAGSTWDTPAYRKVAERMKKELKARTAPL